MTGDWSVILSLCMGAASFAAPMQNDKKDIEDQGVEIPGDFEGADSDVACLQVHPKKMRVGPFFSDGRPATR